MKKIGLFFLFLIVVIGCETVPPATPEDMSKHFAQPYDKIFQAIKNTFFDLNAYIGNGNKEAGFLNGRCKLPSEFVSAVLIGEPRVIYKNYKITFFKKEDGTDIRLNIYTAYEDESYPSKGYKPEYDEF